MDSWDVVKYIVLPVTLIGGAFLIIKNLLDYGLDAAKEVGESLAYLHDDYVREFNEFNADGEIDANEQSQLDAKKEWISVLVDGLKNSLVDPLKIAVAVTAVAGGFWIGYKALKGDFNIKGNVRSFWSKVSAPSESPPLSTPEEWAITYDIMYALEMADLGKVSLASNIITQTQSNYFTSILPKMQSSYNLLLAQMPSLVGAQLAFAQLQATQYSMYLTMYATALPPILGSWIPIMPLGTEAK